MLCSMLRPDVTWTGQCHNRSRSSTGTAGSKPKAPSQPSSASKWTATGRAAADDCHRDPREGQEEAASDAFSSEENLTRCHFAGVTQRKTVML
jgi:hypothetical protein